VTASDPTPVFEGYARFYDLLYADKDYAAECRLLERVFAENGVRPDANILDLGCGTGGHVVPLAEAGHGVTGVDRSSKMLEIARGKAAAAGVEPTLVLGDVRAIDLQRTFDAIISMFAVVGYQLSNHDLASMFAVARRHLDTGGVFIFDAWFGPAVLSVRPEEKRKRVVLEDGSTLARVARPTLDVVAQTVRVDYELAREDGGGDSATEAVESHTMRFLFAQEVAYFLEMAAFEVVTLMPFMRDNEVPTEEDWSVTWVARAVPTIRAVGGVEN